MENNHDIDKKFNEASKMLEEPETFPAFEKVWRTVEEKLDKKEEKKRMLPVWFPYGIAASLILGLGVLYFLDKEGTTAPGNTVIAEKPKDHLQRNQIQTIDSTVKSNIEKEIEVSKSPQKPPALAYENIQIPDKVGKATVVNRNDEIFASRSADYSTDEYFIKNKDINPAPQREQWKDSNKTQNIEEVVLYAPLTYKKTMSTTTSSSTIVSNTSLNYIASNNTTQALQGSVAGLQVQSSGIKRRKGDKIKNTINIANNSYLNNNQIAIRGLSTLKSTNKTLFVVNGKVVKEAYFRALNAQKIESVEVVKGAAASALYGSQGANGVIVVKTVRLSRREKRRMEKMQQTINQYKQNQVSDDEGYDAFVENPFELTKNQPLSTFSIDVDNASYSNVRRMINNGQTVDKNAVRIEEMVNYFTYDYPQPKNDQPFSINTEYNEAPWNPDHKLLKIGLQGKNVPTNQLPASNLIFLIDVSGSMNEQNKLPLLKSSFKVLLDQLRPQDKVGIVVYAGSAGMVLAPTSAKEKEKIIQALDHLQAGGSTAGGEGIELAYKLAQENFVKNGNNRVIIATDGDFNVGASSTSDMETLIEEKRKSGVFLTCLGFGMGNYKDNILETLADKGNGNYAYIDNLQEANKFLGKEFAGSMYAIAKDVKIQIEFNPKYVQSYRLIGYENRRLKNEDFINDTIDAGELGSGHTVTALYEVIPVHVKSEFLPKENDLKYSRSESAENFAGELATIKFRYKKPDGDRSREISQTVSNSNAKIYGASPDFKFASSVAWFGLVARDSHLIKKKDLSEIENLAKQGKSNDEEGYRSEFIRLVESYKTIQK